MSWFALWQLARRTKIGRWILAAIPLAILLCVVLLMAVIVGVVGANQGNCSPSGTGLSSVTAPPPGALSAVQLIEYFEQEGWSPNASAGIVGNMSQESGLNPAEAGGGLVQNGGVKLTELDDYDLQHGLDPSSEAGQLEFLAYFVPLQSWWTQFDGASSPQIAALWFQDNYEQCSGAGDLGTDQVGGGLCNPANRQSQAAAALTASGGSSAPVPVTLISSGVCSVQTGGYVNPLAHVEDLVPERIDMGVDYSGTGEVDAIGDGQITNTDAHGWPGLSFIEERLTGGVYAGKYWYTAECVTPTVSAGQIVTAGEQIGTMVSCGDGIETGWSVGAGGTTLAASLHEEDEGYGVDPGGWSSASGASASRLLQSLGAPAGVMQSGGPHGPLPSGYP